MKAHKYASKIVTMYNDVELSLTELKAKRRLKIALTAMDKVRALRTFKESIFFKEKFTK